MASATRTQKMQAAPGLCASQRRTHVVPKRAVCAKAFPSFSWPFKPKSATPTIPTAPGTPDTGAVATAKPVVASPVVELNQKQLDESLKYALFAKLAYEDDDQKIREGLRAFVGGKYKDVAFKRKMHTGTLWKLPGPGAGIAATTDTEVLAARLPRDDGQPDEMVIAFRGTETSGQGALQDILVDTFALQSHIGDMHGVPKNKYPDSVKIHRGFLRSFNDVVTETDDGSHDALVDVRDELFGKGVIPDRVVCCGHSLGAALATLGAFWLKTISPQTDVDCYAFASPRVGNGEWSKIFEETVDKCYRFIHKNDVVPAVPASRMWEHVNKECFLMEPLKDKYGHTIDELAPGAKYKAIWGKRPRVGKYISVNDHDMGLYIAALEDAKKHCKVA